MSAGLTRSLSSARAAACQLSNVGSISIVTMTTPRAPRGLPPVKRGNDLVGKLAELVEHHLRRAHRSRDELRPAAGDVFLQPFAQERGWAKRRAPLQRRVVDAIAGNERTGDRAGRGAIGGEAKVHERSEMIDRHFAPS